MTSITWGNEVEGLRFALAMPELEAEAGGTIVLHLHARNDTDRPQRLFGFIPGYPRSLRVSPPKANRPWIRVSFGDTNVFHPADAFLTLAPGDTASTEIDLSFAFDRRGAGRWPIAFAYDPVTAAGRIDAYTPATSALTAVEQLVVVNPRSLRDAGIDEATEDTLDMALLQDSETFLQALREHGEGGTHFAARRVARILSNGAESTAGWRALDALSLLGDAGIDALRQAGQELPHAERALAFAYRWLTHRRGDPADAAHLPFIARLDRLIEQPDSRGNFLLTWTAVDSAIHGSRRLQILGDGERLVTLRPPGATVASTRRSNLSPMQLHGLLKALRYAAVWLLQPLREHGLPDEPRPTLEIQLGLGEPFTQAVAMWNGEWRLGPASQLADLLDRLSHEAPPETQPPPRPSRFPEA